MSKVERCLLDHNLLAVDDVEACSCGLFVETTAIEGEVGVGCAFGVVDLLDAGLFVVVAEVEDEGLDLASCRACGDALQLEVSAEGVDGDLRTWIIQGVVCTEVEFSLISSCERTWRKASFKVGKISFNTCSSGCGDVYTSKTGIMNVIGSWVIIIILRLSPLNKIRGASNNLIQVIF